MKNIILKLSLFFFLTGLLVINGCGSAATNLSPVIINPQQPARPLAAPTPTATHPNEKEQNRQADEPEQSNKTRDDKMQATAPASLNVQLSFDVRLDDDNSIYIEVSTNLPDGTCLMQTITDDLGSVYKAGRTLARLTASVSDGRISSGPFTTGDKIYTHGEYTIRLWSLPLGLQPPHVQEAIVASGGLSGDLVIEEEQRVYMEKTFSIIGMTKW